MSATVKATSSLLRLRRPLAAARVRASTSNSRSRRSLRSRAVSTGCACSKRRDDAALSESSSSSDSLLLLLLLLLLPLKIIILLSLRLSQPAPSREAGAAWGAERGRDCNGSPLDPPEPPDRVELEDQIELVIDNRRVSSAGSVVVSGSASRAEEIERGVGSGVGSGVELGRRRFSSAGAGMTLD
jgi:hypothetical protein